MRALAILMAACAIAGCSGAPDDAQNTGDPNATDGGASENEAGTSDGSAGDGGKKSDGGADGLHVVMGSAGAPGHLVDGDGNLVTLHGVDRAGTEYECVDGPLVFDGPVDQSAVDAIKSWRANAVRVPLNEDCWLGINGVTTGGATYRDAIKTWIDLLRSNGLYVILDLHWAAPGTDLAHDQLGMTDLDHAPTFWSQVAAQYGDDSNVIFDLFNEPFITDWNCWLVGGTCAKDDSNADYQVAGMATLLKAVRNAGAKNVVILGGLGYSSDFSQWVAKVQSIPTLAAPNDGLTLENVAASWHTYSSQSEQTLCPSQYNGYSTLLSCVDGATNATNYGVTSVLAAGFPLVTGEIGIDVYATDPSPYSITQATELTTWLESSLTYLDSQQQSYLAWEWNTEAAPLLLSDFDGGVPTPYFGVAYKAHLAALP
ncbi:MAG: glycoside hydrolase family 5 protein [Polyangiaceae bacterium]